MSEVVDFLKNIGSKAVDVLASPAKDVIAKFSQTADALAKEYWRWQAAKTRYAKAGLSWPFSQQELAMSDQVVKNRVYKIELLKMMRKAGANPSNYGLSIYDLTEEEINSAYPGLKYNKLEARNNLGTPVTPFVIAGTVLVALAIATSVTIGLYNSAKKTDFAADMTREYIKQGMSPQKAAAQAAKDLEALNKASGGDWSENIKDAAQFLGWVLVAYGAYKVWESRQRGREA